MTAIIPTPATVSSTACHRLPASAADRPMPRTIVKKTVGAGQKSSRKRPRPWFDSQIDVESERSRSGAQWSAKWLSPISSPRALASTATSDAAKSAIAQGQRRVRAAVITVVATPGVSNGRVSRRLTTEGGTEDVREAN